MRHVKPFPFARLMCWVRGHDPVEVQGDVRCLECGTECMGGRWRKREGRGR